MHNLITGRSCTGVIHFLNQTPIDWFGKRQAQVETATFGSEFVAAVNAVRRAGLTSPHLGKMPEWGDAILMVDLLKIN